MSASAPARALLGFVAAALSVLTFHQGMIFLLHTLAIPGLEVAALPYRFTPVPPLGVPLILDLCFWGGLYGVVFGLVTPAPKGLMPLRGLAFGVLAVLVGFFVVAWIKGNPIGGGWVLANWIRSLLINGLFGVGLGLIYPPLARLVFRAA